MNTNNVLGQKRLTNSIKKNENTSNKKLNPAVNFSNLILLKNENRNHSSSHKPKTITAETAKKKIVSTKFISNTNKINNYINFKQEKEQQNDKIKELEQEIINLKEVNYFINKIFKLIK
jgi:hypothetical protein